MTRNLLSAEDFRAAAKDGGKPDGMVFRFVDAVPETVGETSDRVKRFVFSDETVDRAGDVIKQDGWDLKDFNRNPVALFSHMSWEPPIGRASNVKIQNKQLIGDIEFASADLYPFADTIYRLVDGGFLKAVSVGFMPKEWSFTNDKERPYGIDYRKQYLGEISVCALPCNPNALEVARSAGIDTAPLVEWAEKVLDSGGTVFLPRKELEDLRTQSKTGTELRYYVHSGKSIAAVAAEKVRDAVKRWQADPTEVMILGDGLELRQIARVVADPSIETPLPSDDDEIDLHELIDDIKSGVITSKDAQAKLAKAIAKAGRRISSATKAKLTEAMTHHEAMGSCIKDLMDEAEGDDEADPDGDADDQTLQPEPPGTIVPEDMTEEQRRMKEVRELRDSLPPAD